MPASSFFALDVNPQHSLGDNAAILALLHHDTVKINKGIQWEENDFPPYLARVLNRRHRHYGYLSGDIEEVDKALKTHLEEEETT